ncbi:carbonic anhydrase 2-like [Harmonia axyridis]|uniref:carbonic anhydrase 2-like n=1 Tax=Harmonia axyridis TaxID=115357 RepID=UPI001E27562D|nr:carbonic anhydrase 2-like [Harmonia axyridis]
MAEDVEDDIGEEITDEDYGDAPQYYLLSLADREARFESPINISLGFCKDLILPHLCWYHFDKVPKKMKITNTGHTLILSAKYYEERPYIANGPLIGKYVFSQLHFHWGCNNMEGSEHTIDGSALPGEMHVVTFKSCYLTQESALKEKDGVAVISYFFKLQNAENPVLQRLLDAIPEIKDANSSFKLEPWPLSNMLMEFDKDYMVYWGSVTASGCHHFVLWFICRYPIGASLEQMESFRELNDSHGKPLIRNFRPVNPLSDRHVFHVNPSENKHSTLYPLALSNKRQRV